MTPLEAFLLATAAAYMAAALFSLLGHPAQQDIPPQLQFFIYIGLGSLLVLSVGGTLPPLFIGALGGFYGFLSVASFIGWPQKWYAYWKPKPEEGDAVAQIGMGFWDLALATVLIYISSL